MFASLGKTFQMRKKKLSNCKSYFSNLLIERKITSGMIADAMALSCGFSECTSALAGS
jgi:hypothetical protein